MRVAGVTFPCVDCRQVHRNCRQKVEVMRRVFFAIGNGKEVSCSDHEEERYHGIEGVRA